MFLFTVSESGQSPIEWTFVLLSFPTRCRIYCAARKTLLNHPSFDVARCARADEAHSGSHGYSRPRKSPQLQGQVRQRALTTARFQRRAQLILLEDRSKSRSDLWAPASNGLEKVVGGREKPARCHPETRR